MKKIIRRIFVSLSAVSLALTLSVPIISSHMQSYYKGLIGTENTQVWLEKKRMWATLGETEIFAILFLIFLFLLFISELIIRLKK